MNIFFIEIIGKEIAYSISCLYELKIKKESGVKGDPFIYKSPKKYLDYT